MFFSKGVEKNPDNEYSLLRLKPIVLALHKTYVVFEGKSFSLISLLILAVAAWNNTSTFVLIEAWGLVEEASSISRKDILTYGPTLAKAFLR